VKRALEGLREGLKGASTSVAQTVTVFSSQARSDALLTRKFTDASDCLEERSRVAAEGCLSTAVGSVTELLSSLGEKSRFERRKALLLDLDSYKRKVKDLRDKEASGGKVDHSVVADKEEKLRSAERAFSDCNDDLMEMMQDVQDKKAELMERQLVAAADAVTQFFTTAGAACAPLGEAIASTKANPIKATLTRDSKEPGESPARGRVAEVGAALKAADPFGADPFASPTAAAPSAAPAGGAAQRQAAFDYAATEAGELSFTKGDLIAVLAEDASGWWQGRNTRTGETGSFPHNYTVAAQAQGAQPARAEAGAIVPVAAQQASPAAKDPFW